MDAWTWGKVFRSNHYGIHFRMFRKWITLFWAGIPSMWYFVGCGKWSLGKIDLRKGEGI